MPLLGKELTVAASALLALRATMTASPLNTTFSLKLDTGALRPSMQTKTLQ